MTKENNSNRENQARPADRAHTLAEQLQSIHPADLFQGAHILAEFAGEAMRDVSFTAGHGGTFSDAEELAVTIEVVLRDSPKEFSSLLPDYLRLLGMVRAFCVRQGGNELAVAQLNRIAKALAVDDAAAVIPALAPARARRAGHWLKSKAVIVAAIALALLIWDISSDGLMLWQIIAAIGLVGCIGGAAFRLGQRLPIQTPVVTALAAGDKDADRKVDHSR